MPDLDILHTRAAPGWYRPARMTKGNAPPHEVADAGVKCLAAELRRSGGLPRMAELCDVLRSASRRERADLRLEERLRLLEGASGASLHVQLAYHAAASVLVELDGADVPAEKLGRRLALEYCRRLIENRLLGPVLPALVGDRFSDDEAATAWTLALWKELGPGFDAIADRLARNPSAIELRAPNRRVRARSTAELLHQPL